MKKSLSKQVLFLSLAALVVVSTGCERRGRAPAKPKQEKTAGGEQQTVAGDPTKDTPAPTDASATTVEKAPEDAKMDCSITLSNGEPTAQSFAADSSRFNELLGCLKANGVDLQSATNDEPLDVETFITPDGNTLVGIKRTRSKDDSADAPSLRGKFDQLALADGSNDDIARRILEARLDFLKVACQKMAARYDGKIDPSTKTEDTTLEGLLAKLDLFQEVADKAIKELADFRTVAPDGEDLKSAAGDIH